MPGDFGRGEIPDFCQSLKKMRHCCKSLICVFSFVVVFISAQAQLKIDSLMNVLKIAREDTNKARTMNALSYQLSQEGEYDKSKKYANDALQFSKKIHFKKGEGDAYNNLGIIYNYLGNYPEAMINYFSSLNIKEKTGDKIGMAKSCNNIGMIYYHQGNYPDALKQFFASLKIAEEMGNKLVIATLRNNIGNVYLFQNNYADALKNYSDALKIREEIGDKKGAAGSYNGIGNVNNMQKNYPDALKNYFTALKIWKEIGDKEGVSSSYSNIGCVYVSQDNYADGLKIFLSALKIQVEIGDKLGIALSYTNIGPLYTTLKNFPKAKKYLDEGLALSKEIGAKAEIINSYLGLIELDSTVGNYKQALEHYKQYIVYKDSLLNETNNKQTAQMKIQYETEKKEKEITVLTKNKQIQDAEIKKQTLLKKSLIGGLALSFILFFFIYKNYRTRQKLKLENIRNNIAADLHDDIGSTLNSISLFSEVAKQQAGKPIPALDQIGVSARKIIDGMSDIVWTINPENDSFENVIVRMRSLAYLLMKAKAIEFTFKADENLNQLSLPMPVRKNVYLLFKEAINNLVTYSNATRAFFHLSLVLTSSGKNVKMVIRDNGVGFDMENALMGNGIKNMKRRAAEIGAQLLIESAEGKGTNIELSFKTK